MNNKLVIIIKNYSRTGKTQVLNIYPVDFKIEDRRMLEQEMQKLGELKFKICYYSNSYEVKVRNNGVEYTELLAQNLRKKGYTVKLLF